MATRRTSLVLDDASRSAARELASLYQCSMAEAIRRAIISHRNAVRGVPAERRKERLKALVELAQLFEGHDADAEIRALKAADEFS